MIAKIGVRLALLVAIGATIIRRGKDAQTGECAEL